jgi:hypothetical protein
MPKILGSKFMIFPNCNYSGIRLLFQLRNTLKARKGLVCEPLNTICGPIFAPFAYFVVPFIHHDLPKLKIHSQRIDLRQDLLAGESAPGDCQAGTL